MIFRLNFHLKDYIEYLLTLPDLLVRVNRLYMSQVYEFYFNEYFAVISFEIYSIILYISNYIII